MKDISNLSSTTWPLEPHTQAKHEILKRYLQAWFPILSTYNGRIIYIDGFAGPGEYSNGEYGSPIIAINTAKEHKSKQKSEIVFLFIEAETKRVDHLENILKTINLPENIKYEVFNSKFDETLTSILNRVEEKGKQIAPTFAFIDPFGFSDTPFSVVEKLLNHQKCEVLITFMSGFMNRFKNDPKNNKHFDTLFGTNDWRNVITVDSDAIDIVSYYNTRLNTVAEYVYSFEMINKFNQIIFHLVFCTNNIKGLKVMKDAMWSVDETGSFSFSDRADPNQTVLFKHEPDYQHLKKLMIAQFKGKQVSIKDIENFVIAKTPYKDTHFKRQILKPMELSDSPEIEVINSKRQRKGSFPKGTIINFL